MLLAVLPANALRTAHPLLSNAAARTYRAAAANHPVAGIYDWDRIAGTGGPGCPRGLRFACHGRELTIGDGASIRNLGHRVELVLAGPCCALGAQRQVKKHPLTRQIGFKLANCFT